MNIFTYFHIPWSIIIMRDKKNPALGGDTSTSPDQLSMTNVIFNSALIAVAETIG